MKHGFDVVAVIPFFSLRPRDKVYLFRKKSPKGLKRWEVVLKTNFFGFHSIFNLSRNFIPECCWRRKKSLKPEKKVFKLFGSSFVKTSKIDFVRIFFPRLVYWAEPFWRQSWAARAALAWRRNWAEGGGWERGGGSWNVQKGGLKPISKRKNGFKMRMRKPTLIFLEAKKSILGFFSSLEVKFVAAAIV